MSLMYRSTRLGRFAAMAGAAVMAGQTPARAASFQDIYNFIGGSSDGQEPESGLAVDDLGRLVGTTPLGGPFDLGVVYRLTPPGYAGAPWTEQVLYGFASAGYPTTDPIAPVIVQGANTIFGTAASGGKGDAGFVYRLDDSGAQWVLSVLHSFTGGMDGSDPAAGVTTGPSGKLYGPTARGGAYGGGALYSVSPTAAPATFQAAPQPNGSYGASRPLYTAGRLIYTSSTGGANGLGAVMGTEQTAPGHFHTSTLYSFAPSGDAANPAPDSPPLAGPHRTLYGCAAGGAFGTGAVYQLKPPATAGAPWTESVLYSFGAKPLDPDGSYGQCYITLSPKNQVVGVTFRGGAYHDGALFALDPPTEAGGAWTETVLHNFNGRKNYGLFYPQGVPVRIGNTYYGTANAGGALSPVTGLTAGGVWSFTP